MMRRMLLFLLPLAAAGCAGAPEPCGPVPTPSQMEWQKMEVNMFCHFGPNTFSGLEWGEGTEPEDLFNPVALDCRQWARTAAAAGMKGIIVTAKHHDGFCLWSNPESTHTVAQSSWRGGSGDVLKELSEACREYG
ncbi:MAG: alpha-L-fucosidase, partial [Bacteroidales bacterium]|nr:alpha-L-fucosidase [Bacteroidales bacterium]